MTASLPPRPAAGAAIDYRAILNPGAEQRGRASQVLSNLAGRTFWHKLFDNTPSLASTLGDQGSVDALLAFLAASEEGEVSLDWRMPLLFLAWLGTEPVPRLADGDTHVLECLGAAAAGWAGEVTDVGMHRMILACGRTGLAVGATRPLTIDGGPKVFRLQVEARGPGSRFRRSVSDNPHEWRAGGWQEVSTAPF